MQPGAYAHSTATIPSHPYPDVAGIQLRADSFPTWLLAQVDRESWPRKLHLLDAGCGTGVSLAAVAALHPEAHVAGVDLSEPSIARARERLAGRPDVELIAGDLHDPAVTARLRATAPSGFDVIWLSGILHHVPDPAALLARLVPLLAVDGVVSVMVYGAYGRLPATRLSRALALAEPDPAARGALARTWLRALEPGPILRAPFDDGRTVGDVELADRYLHPLARPMRVEELFATLDAGGLRWLRWLEPRAWSPRARLGPEAAASLGDLDERAQALVLQELFDHPSLECLATHPERAGRPAADGELAGQVVDRNPQVALQRIERSVGPVLLDEGVQVRLRAGAWEPLDARERALFLVCNGPILGSELIAAAGLTASEGDAGLRSLLERELFFRPV